MGYFFISPESTDITSTQMKKKKRSKNIVWNTVGMEHGIISTSSSMIWTLFTITQIKSSLRVRTSEGRRKEGWQTFILRCSSIRALLWEGHSLHTPTKGSATKNGPHLKWQPHWGTAFMWHLWGKVTFSGTPRELSAIYRARLWDSCRRAAYCKSPPTALWDTRI